MTKDQYICRRAANAILSEIGPYQISSDALQTINQFLDQVLALLLQNTQSLKPTLVKPQLLALLPLNLGKNALVEAELEVKTYTETNRIHSLLYDEQDTLNEPPAPFPLEQVWISLRSRCIEHSTLTEKFFDSPTSNDEPGMVFSPVVIIYFTAILEHIAEYILTIIAITAERDGAKFIRIKEVYSALVNDGQVGELFKQTDLQSKLEKRVLSYQAQQQPPYQTYSLPTSSSATTFKNQVSVHGNSGYQVPELSYDHDPDDDLHSESTHSRTSSSIKSGQSSSDYQPVSVFSNITSSSSNRSSSSSSKRTFRFFGKKDRRSSTPAHHHPHDLRVRSPPTPPSLSSPLLHDSNIPALDFEDLMRSGNTIKVSLTPNRLRSIEIKSSSSSTTQQQHPPPKKMGFFHSSTPPPLSAPILSHPTPVRAFPPNGTPFENPRAAPKPPIATYYQPKTSFETPPLTPDSSIASRLSTTRSPSPSFEEEQPSPPPPPPQQQQQKRTTRYVKQTSSTPLQLSGRSSRHRKQESIDTLSTDVCAMDLPSPPNTIDHHPSSTIFNGLEDNNNNNKPIYNRPSSMVAKRAASGGMTRPASCYENFAMGYEIKSTSSQPTSIIRSSSPIGRMRRSATTRPSSTTIIEEVEEEQQQQQALDAGTKQQDMTTTISSRNTKIMVNSSMQTDPLPGLSPLTAPQSIPTFIFTTDDQQPSTVNNDDHDDDDDDEEWFLEDDDWDDVQYQDSVMAEWLLGET